DGYESTRTKCALARADEPDRLVPLKQIHETAQGLPSGRSKRGIAFQHKSRVVARRADELGVGLDARNPKSGHARLARAQNVALAAQPQILLGNAEAIFHPAHDVEASLRGLAERRLVEQHAG